MPGGKVRGWGVLEDGGWRNQTCRQIPLKDLVSRSRKFCSLPRHEWPTLLHFCPQWSGGQKLESDAPCTVSGNWASVWAWLKIQSREHFEIKVFLLTFTSFSIVWKIKNIFLIQTSYYWGLKPQTFHAVHCHMEMLHHLVELIQVGPGAWNVVDVPVCC